LILGVVDGTFVRPKLICELAEDVGPGIGYVFLVGSATVE